MPTKIIKYRIQLKTTHDMDNKEIQDTLSLMTSDQADQRYLGWQLLYSQYTQDELITFFEWVERIAFGYDKVSETLKFVTSGDIPNEKTLNIFKRKFRASCVQGGWLMTDITHWKNIGINIANPLTLVSMMTLVLICQRLFVWNT